MLPDWVSNPEPLTYESGALLTVLRGPAYRFVLQIICDADSTKGDRATV